MASVSLAGGAGSLFALVCPWPERLPVYEGCPASQSMQQIERRRSGSRAPHVFEVVLLLHGLCSLTCFICLILDCRYGSTASALAAATTALARSWPGISSREVTNNGLSHRDVEFPGFPD